MSAPAARLGKILSIILIALPFAAARASDGPPAGRYEIRSYHAASSASSREYGITTYMLLRADGSYEFYDSKSNELRSRGTFIFEPGTAGAPGSVGLVRWKSGINYDMGRGGSFFLRNAAFKCERCIQLGSYVMAVWTR